MRILLSEGASTSAREAITALRLSGHEIEVCDPDMHCLGRFSRLVTRFHRCPGLGADPAGYLAFIVDLVSTGRFDVLLPIHEQGLLFAKVVEQLGPHAAVALPSFENYVRIHNKAAFSRLLDELDIPQPRTRLVDAPHELSRFNDYPFVLKAAVGTASRGTWIIQSGADLEVALSELKDMGGCEDTVLVQDFVLGALEHAQAVFRYGEVVGFHAWRQVTRGAGGGDAIKESVRRPLVRGHIARLGQRLDWHGALTLDYIVDEERDQPLYIDGNPRLVEPMGAAFAGLDLADLLVRISCGDNPPPAPESKDGVRTHLALQALMGHVLAGGTRTTLLRECGRLLFKRGPYAGSLEELTPVRLDGLSIIPTLMTALWLLTNPRAALYLPKRGWGSHLLNPASVRAIRGMGSRPSATAP